MKKIQYLLITLLNSIGFLTVFGFLVIMQIEVGKWNSEISFLENKYSETRAAYSRFVNGRTLNSDYAFWKDLDTRFSGYQLNKTSQAEFLKGVAVFQKAFWKKYYEKNENVSNSQNIANWEHGYKSSNDELRKKINSRFPLKEAIGKKLNILSNIVGDRLATVRIEYENLKTNLFFQYGLFGFMMFYCFVFYFRREVKTNDYVVENKSLDDIDHVPTMLVKLHDEDIVSFSNKVKEITPNIGEYKNWNDYFLTNFILVKNVSGDKIVSLRKKQSSRYKLSTSINGKNRYINFSPVVTLLKESGKIPAGNDSLKETIRESSYRVELLCDKLKFNIIADSDVLISDILVQKIEEVMSMAGTFYKRLADIQNKKISIETNIKIEKKIVTVFFESGDVRLDTGLLKNISNFNFSFYPQKIENILQPYDGRVSLRNKYKANKLFVSSLFQISFVLSKSKYKANSQVALNSGMSN